MNECSTERLAARLCAGEDTISFDKDDDDTLDFVTAAANLRSAAYGIPGKSRWEVKGQPIPQSFSFPRDLIISSFSHTRNGWEHHPRDCHDERDYFGPNSSSSTPSFEEILPSIAKRSCSVQA